MTDRLEHLGENFWSVRGSLKMAPLLDIGTQCALVRLSNGRFLFLDSYKMSSEVRSQIDALTDGGAKVDAIINLHPFHTLHCEWMAAAYPAAVMYGTARHHRLFPEITWADEFCESDILTDRFGSDFRFSIPQGVPLVCANESVHFSSILALHKASGTIHVDDTLVYLDKGFPLSLLPMNRRVDFHPTLAKALERRSGAAGEFREWAIQLGIDWAEARRIAAAHSDVRELQSGEFPELIGAALGRVKPTLDAHRAKYG